VGGAVVLSTLVLGTVMSVAMREGGAGDSEGHDQRQETDDHAKKSPE
jgi:hypothetical protein